MITQIDFQVLKDCRVKRHIINEFSPEHLTSIAQELQDKIVLLDLSKNKDPKVFNQISQFIKSNCRSWRGIELNFTFQNNIIQIDHFSQINNSIQDMSNLESLCLTFGGVYVSRSWAEYHSEEYSQFKKIGGGWHFYFEDYSCIIQSFVKIIEKSPNLKRIWVDLQALRHNCQKLLPILTELNYNLERCSELQEYILSMNHCEMIDVNGTLSQFLDSFICLRNKQYLRKFIMNISDWNLNYYNIQQICTIFSDYLINKNDFVEFEFDHSYRLTISKFDDPNKLNEIQLLKNSFIQFLQSNQHTLRKFYLSLVDYRCSHHEVREIKEIFKPLSECLQLERISIRLQQWKCKDYEVEREFYQDMKQLKQLKYLKFFYLASFSPNRDSDQFNLARQFLHNLGIRREIYKNTMLISKAINKSDLVVQYRKDILIQIQQILSQQEIQHQNKFLITRSIF